MKLQKVVSGLLAFSMMATMVPCDVSAQTNLQEKKSSKVLTGQSELQKKVEELKNKKKERKYVEGEILLVSKAGKSKKENTQAINAVRGTAKELGLSLKESTILEAGKKPALLVSKISSDKLSTEELLALYKGKDKDVIAQPNYIYSALDIDKNSYEKELWGLDNQGQSNGALGLDINPESDKVKATTDKEQIIAVIDTGVDYDHELLKDYIWENPYTAYLSGKHGYDTVNDDADPMDDAGHGSHCAGIISSVAESCNTRIMPLKFLDAEGYGDTYDAVEAYRYIYTAMELGANVVAVSNSWGGGDPYSDEDQALGAAIDMVGEAGAITVCAAGNEYSELGVEYITSPACIDSEYIVSVAAVNEKGELADFSNYGCEYVDVAAPGADILSTVSYNNFTPRAYGKDENGNYKNCEFFQEFSGNLVEVATALDEASESKPGQTMQKLVDIKSLDGNQIPYFYLRDYMDEDEIQKMKVEVVSDEYFGGDPSDKTSLKWTIKDAKENENYILVLPYIQPATSTLAIANVMVKAKITPEKPETSYAPEDVPMVGWGTGMGVFDKDTFESINYDFMIQSVTSGEENYWTQCNPGQDKAKKEQVNALMVAVVALGDGDIEVHIDDFAVSKPNLKEEEYGKTAYYNGTSMATPYVSGAVAAMAAAYPKDDALDRKARVLGAVTKLDTLKGKVATDGMLDLNHADQQGAFLKEVSLNEKGQLLISGRYFDKNASVTVEGVETKKVSGTDKEILLSGDFYNKRLKITVTSDGRELKANKYFAKGKTPKLVGLAANVGYNLEGSSVLTNGNMGYMVGDNGEIEYFDNVGIYSDVNDTMGEKAQIFQYCTGISAKDIFGKTSENDWVAVESPTMCNQTIYAVANLYKDYAMKSVLVSFDMETMKWKKIANLPDGYLGLDKKNEYYAYRCSTLAGYNGKLYLMGGYDNQKKEAVKDVYVYDTKTKKWSKGAELPEGRFAAKAVQTGNKLVLTLGGGSKKSPKNMIFDGKNWTISKAEIILGDPVTYEESYKPVTPDTPEASMLPEYYTGDVSAVKGGLIYSNCQAEKYGDIFTYDIATDSYKATDFTMDKIFEEQAYVAGTLDDKFIMMTSGKPVYDEILDFYLSGDYEIYEIPVNSANYRVTVKDNIEGGFISGCGLYNAGDSVQMQVALMDNFYLKSMKVDGKSVAIKGNGNNTTYQIANINKDILVDVIYGAYVSEIQLDKSEFSLLAGNSYQLKTTVLPAQADNKAVTYTSSDSKVVTVDSKGKITAKKTAGGKSAVITVRAKDRGTVVAKAKVTVAKKVAVKKITLSTKKNQKTLKAGKSLKITASISPKNATNKEITWSVSNKKYATIKNGKLTAKKAGIGKTVTVTAKAKDGSKKKATMKIKIVK